MALGLQGLRCWGQEDKVGVDRRGMHWQADNRESASAVGGNGM